MDNAPAPRSTRKPRATTNPALAAKINQAIADNPRMDRRGIVALLVEAGEEEAGLYQKVNVRHPDGKAATKTSKRPHVYFVSIEDRMKQVLEDAEASLADIDKEIEALKMKRVRFAEYVMRNKNP